MWARRAPSSTAWPPAPPAASAGREDRRHTDGTRGAIVQVGRNETSPEAAPVRPILVLAAILLALSRSPGPAVAADAGKLFVVDCLLPPQVRQLGSKLTYAAARRAVKTTAADCELRGGEYVAYDRASPATALKTWLPAAQEGDAEAQTYVGEIFEKGVGGRPDYAAAAEWYLKAAERGHARAALNLGAMFEQGLGLARDPAMALFWYRRAAGVEGLAFPQVQPQPAAAAAPAAVPAPAATIEIIEPELSKTRGRPVARLRGGAPERLVVVGQVQGDAPVASVTLNGQSATMLGERVFRVELLNVRDAGAVRVVVVDVQGRRSEMEFGLGDGAGTPAGTAEAPAPTPAPAPAEPVGLPVRPGELAGSGRSFALVVGNNGYSALPRLDTAVADAKAMAALLEQDYGFGVRLLVDADRYAILSALNDLRLQFGPDDRLLVYYAGHGELDRINQRGHWLPVDAEPQSPANWISNVAITDMLNVIPARQLLVIADSCYSGMMSRSALGTVDPTVEPQERLRLLQGLAGARTRTALTSGGVAPVIDTLDGRHSVFAGALLEVLQANRGALTGEQLYQAVAPRVALAARRVGFVQVPEYAPLKFAGHEAGDFLLVKAR